MILPFSRNPDPRLAVAVARHLDAEPKRAEAAFSQRKVLPPIFWKPDLPHVFVRRESTSVPAFVYNSH